MYVDDCRHTFEELATTVLPAHMQRLQAAIAATRSASEFGEIGVGTIAVASRVGLLSDFGGCYVFLKGDRPIYVGICRRVISRVRQHVRGKTHFDASLAYAMARRRLPTVGGRAAAMENQSFKEEFDKVQQYIRGLRVAFIEITNPLELYVFEAYAALSLRTHKWNTFRTH